MSNVRTLDKLPLDTQDIPSIQYDAFFTMETELFKTLIRDLNDHTGKSFCFLLLLLLFLYSK